ncbi:MAG TPA: hypothetical protein VIG47_08865 [Gemmatimonadaceae bacterium]
MPGKRAAKRAGYPAPSTAVAAPLIMEIKAGVFKDTCLQLLDEVHDGNVELVVTKYGEAVARVIPPDVAVPSAFGFMSGTILATGDIVAPDFDAWGDVG